MVQITDLFLGTNPNDKTGTTARAGGEIINDNFDALNTAKIEQSDIDSQLGNVDNTSDVNKPISNATQSALNNKVDKVSGKSLVDNSEITKLTTVDANAEENITENIFAGANVSIARVGKDVTVSSTGGAGTGTGNNGAFSYFTTGGTTNPVITLPFEYDTSRNNLFVYVGGVFLKLDTDYTQTSSTTITLTLDPELQDDIIVIYPNKGINWKGNYSNTTGYIIDDAVFYEGSSYICIADSTGDLPTDTAFWNIVAKGEVGPQGPAGIGDMESSVYDPLNKSEQVVTIGDFSPAHSVLVQQSGTSSPETVSIGTNTLLGRLSGGGSQISSLSASDVRGLLGLEPVNIDSTSGDTYGAITGAVNGVNKVFTVSNGSYTSGTVRVIIEGVSLMQGSSEDWVETNPSTGTITINTAPLTGENLIIIYN